MKRVLIAIFALIPMFALAQSELTPQQQLEEAQKRLKEAQQALEAAKINAQAAQLKATADSIEQETAKKKAATEANQNADTKQTSEQGWVVPTTPVKKEQKKEVKKNAQGVALKEDPKYLEGAISLNDEGKVEFTLDTDANGKSAQQIYDIVYNYMSDLTQGEDNIKSRLALVNKDEHIIANTMDEWFVFNASFISIDRTECKYNLIAKIQDNHLSLSINHIIFNYEEGRSTGFKDAAENIITDKIALTKKKNDLAKIYGKFRKATIDRKEQIFNELTTLVKQ